MQEPSHAKVFHVTVIVREMSVWDVLLSYVTLQGSGWDKEGHTVHVPFPFDREGKPEGEPVACVNCVREKWSGQNRSNSYT